uniref:Uncharacterized protein n=1 Tax=Mycena chlorophos TaxID=658473 RepID=A0ABQ0M8Y0_MYCCL|nr:predicted protein [Mycena chlorophos]
MSRGGPYNWNPNPHGQPPPIGHGQPPPVGHGQHPPVGHGQPMPGHPPPGYPPAAPVAYYPTAPTGYPSTSTAGGYGPAGYATHGQPPGIPRAHPVQRARSRPPLNFAAAAGRGLPPGPPGPSQHALISIHHDTNFALSAAGIEQYMKQRVKLLSDVIAGQQLEQFIHAAFRTKHTRVVEEQRDTRRPSRRLLSIEVTGSFGLKFRISDIYTLLGYLISETDRYSYTGNEENDQLCLIHLKILAFYERWIRQLAQQLISDPSEVAPNTACVMYRKDPRDPRPTSSWVIWNKRTPF